MNLIRRIFGRAEQSSEQDGRDQMREARRGGRSRSFGVRKLPAREPDASDLYLIGLANMGTGGGWSGGDGGGGCGGGGCDGGGCG